MPLLPSFLFSISFTKQTLSTAPQSWLREKHWRKKLNGFSSCVLYYKTKKKGCDPLRLRVSRQSQQKHELLTALLGWTVKLKAHSALKVVDRSPLRTRVSTARWEVIKYQGTDLTAWATSNSTDLMGARWCFLPLTDWIKEKEGW